MRARASVSVSDFRSAKKEQEETLRDLAEGKIDVLIGTHAVIQDAVEFRNLALVITDEQHRFGVDQRKN